MKKKALLIFVLVFSLLLCGCAVRRSQSTDELLIKLLEISGEDFEDNGSFYFSEAGEGSLGYFSEEDKSLMYGENTVKQTFDKIESCAVFVCARVPGEIGVFKCYSSSDTDEVARMCLERADSIKILLKNSEWMEKSNNICVTVHKKYVLFSFCDNSQKLEKKLKQLV